MTLRISHVHVHVASAHISFTAAESQPLRTAYGSDCSLRPALQDRVSLLTTQRARANAKRSVGLCEICHDQDMAYVTTRSTRRPTRSRRRRRRRCLAQRVSSRRVSSQAESPRRFHFAGACTAGEPLCTPAWGPRWRPRERCPQESLSERIRRWRPPLAVGGPFLLAEQRAA